MSSSYQGLFGDAWLTCELSVTDTTADPSELSDRAGRWCVGVAEAASRLGGDSERRHLAA